MEYGSEKEMPSMEKAHAHVASGEEYLSQGLLVCAFPEFYKAAELFLALGDLTSNPQTKQTLKLLYNENNKRGKEVQRRISQSKEEAATFPLSHTQKPNILAPTPRHGSPSYLNGRETSLAASQRTIDDSYMVLGGKVDPQDPFNQFWNKLEQMLDNLSQPVAFATVPLTSSVEVTGSHSNTDGVAEESSRDFSPLKSDNARQAHQESLEEQLAQALEDDEELIDGMDESFYMIPATTPPPSEQRLRTENEMLKQELDITRQKLANTERILKNRMEQERALRESIISVRKEAQRAITSSALAARPGSMANLDATLPNVFPQAAGIIAQHSSNPLGPERETQYVRRIRELEEEVRQSRVENEKNRATIQRFRERWEKLKESAKRKRSARAAESARGGGVKETIQEEPELEENV